MMVHQVYAIISEGIVKNVMVCDNYEMANILAREIFGEYATAVDCLQYPCSAGDTYVDGIFYYRDTDTVIERTLTESESIEVLQQQKLELESQLTDIQIAVAELFEGGVGNG